MLKINCNLIWSSVLALSLMACGGASDESETTDNQDEIETVDEGETSEATPEEVLTPVDYKQLQDLLPGTAAGIARKQAIGSAESNSSAAIGSYEAPDGNKLVLITITDEASNETPSEESDLEVETDEATTTAKNTKVQSYPAYETYILEKNGNGSGTIHIRVKNRFRVEIRTVLISQEEMRKVAESLDLEKLAAMK